MQIPIIQSRKLIPFTSLTSSDPRWAPIGCTTKKRGGVGSQKRPWKIDNGNFCKFRQCFANYRGGRQSLIALNNKMILRSRKNINPVTFVQFQNKPSQIIATWEDLAATCCWPSLYFKLDIFVSSFWPWWVGAKVGFVCLELLLEFHWDDPQASREKAGHNDPLKIWEIEDVQIQKYTNHIYEGLLLKLSKPMIP